MEKNNIGSIISKSILSGFIDGFKIVLKKPSLAWFLLKSWFQQRRASKRRKDLSEKGLTIPTLMIMSITNRCNLSCKGCYAQAIQREQKTELTTDELNSIFNQASRLGISIILLAGGEPFTRPDIIQITQKHPGIIFPVFTNGLLITEATIKDMEKQKNLMPIISIEGYESETDLRRGDGVYNRFLKTACKLKDRNVFWGVSITVTITNFDLVTNDEFLKKITKCGCKIFFFVEYVPIKEETAELVPTNEQRVKLLELMESLRTKHKALFVAFPGEEEKYGGCLSSGRGFIHISADGSLEPCPFSPYSDVNLKDVSLYKALQSEFLSELRANPGMLAETSGGCALWENRDWVQSLINLGNKEAQTYQMVKDQEI
jgi:MoaA/NifB/PqqE/SkfB family radical SAM enzyme